MKMTVTQLRKLIKEEISKTLKENVPDYYDDERTGEEDNYVMTGAEQSEYNKKEAAEREKAMPGAIEKLISAINYVIELDNPYDSKFHEDTNTDLYKLRNILPLMLLPRQWPKITK